jgi:hypothetical protein
LKQIWPLDATGREFDMIKDMLSTVSFTMFVLFGDTGFAQEVDFKKLTYDLLSEGEDIGDITLKLLKEEKRYVILEKSHIDVSGWWWRIDITTVLFEQFDQGGVLKHSDGKTLDEDTIYWTQISSDNDQYQASFRSIKKITDQDKKQFSKLSFAVSDPSSNNVDEVVSLSKLIFSRRDQQAERSSFSQADFDTTWNGLPFFIQKQAGGDLPNKLSILDSEDLEIFQVTLDDLGYEVVSDGANEIPARHLRLSDGKYKPTDLWIYDGTNTDQFSMPYMIRYTGENQDGPFEAVLKAQ